MNKRAVIIGVIYALIVVIYKLIIVLGGYTLTKFGFYYSNIVSVFCVIPFLIFAIKQVRDKDQNGIISGRDAMRMALTVSAIAAIILFGYHYIEFEWKFRDIAIEYYNSSEYLEYLKKQPKVKEADYPSIIKEQIASLSAFKASTGKLFPFLLIALSSSFISAVFMKKNPA